MRARYIIWLLILVAVAALVVVFQRSPKTSLPANSSSNNNSTVASAATNTNQVAPPVAPNFPLVDPISRAGERITKKLFGTYVTPQNSPVQPERFKGYHTGLDFETFPEEQTTDVAIMAVCSGKVLVARYASGYGGVLVQACAINGQAVTIIYGHLRLSSIKPKIGDTMTAGQQFAVLGTGYSTETDGERKHLHLGIHKGTSVVLLGYVQTKSGLDQFLDPAKYLPL